MTPTPHDALFKATFSQPEHAAGALRAVLPPALSARLDFDTLALRAGSFVDETLADSHTDLLFTARLAGRDALVYLLFEHRSTPHPRMPFRALKYMVRIWDTWLREHPEARLLPAIVPVVLHHGEGGWTAATSFEEQIDLDLATRRAMGKHLPRFSLLLDDLSGQDDDALHGRAMSALGKLALLCFKHARDPDELVKRLGRWADVVRDVWGAPNGVSALSFVVRYIFEIGGERPVKALRTLAAKKVGKDVEEAIVTYADQLRSEGRTEGRREGRRAGLREGRNKGRRAGLLEGRREMLLRQLRARFGELPAPLVARVNAAGIERLDGWAERVLTAPTLDELFAER